MAFPAVAASNTYSSTGAATHAVAMPSGISAGDLLIVYFAARNDNGDNLVESGGSSWTRVAQNREGTDFLQAAWFAKVAAGGDTLTVDTGNTTGDAVAISLRITGHGVSNPATDLTASADAEDATTAAPNPGNCNPGVAADYLWLEGSAAHSSVSTSATYWSTNYTGVAQLRSAAGSAVLAGVAYRQLNAASEDPGAMTMTNDNGSVAHTLAVPPAAGGGLSIPVAMCHYRSMGMA